MLGAALACGLAVTGIAQAIPQPIYFFSNVAATISMPGGGPQQSERVIRPAEIGLFADGSWDIENLHWTGWGSSVARGSGISSASNGIPNMAQGKRIKTPATIVLSKPGRFGGREVYRCYVLRLPSDPSADQHRCISDHGGYSFFE